MPEQNPRRGEYTAWGLAAVLAVTWLVLQFNDGRFAGAALVLFAFLFVSGLVISLNNWMERRSKIVLSEQGIAFQNGLRDISFRWDEVETVRVLPTAGGSRRVQVLGSQSHFEFRTLSEMKFQGRVEARSGYLKGDDILSTLVAKAGLQPQNPGEMVVYYARE